MKNWIIVGLLALTWGAAARAEGFATTHSLTNGTVTVSNGQANSSWTPVAILIQYAGTGAATVTVRRVSQGVDRLLDYAALTNVSSLVWVPPAAIPFAYGDALVLTSSQTNGTAQVIRRGD